MAVEVIYSEILSQENIACQLVKRFQKLTSHQRTDDPKTSPRKINVYTLERANTGTPGIKNIIAALKWIVLAPKRKREFGKA